MKKIIKIVSSLAIFISVVLIILFRTIPVSKLWDKYMVLYVPVETDDSAVLDALDKSGISNVVALSGQFLPLNISENSLEYAMFKTTIDEKENEYVNKRNAYFFDESNRYRLYYIPKKYEKNVSRCVDVLKRSDIEWGLDTTAKYPLLFPLIVTIMTIAICFFSRNKALFLCASLIPVIYLYCNPFFPIALSIMLLILCAFFISNVWKRRGAISYLNSFIFIPFCFVAALLCGFASSIISGILFIAAATGMIGVFITYYWVEDVFRNKKSFIPVYIIPAKEISPGSSKFGTVFTIVSICGVLLLGVFTFTTPGSFEGNSKTVMLPSATGSESEDLPQLEDYYKWAWNVTTYPYRSLNGDNSELDNLTVTFPKFTTTENGVIKETESVLSYDDKFEKDVFEGINNLSFDSIEEVMQSEGSGFKGGYNSTSSYHIDLFGIIMVIMCYFILLFIYFSIIIRARKGAKNDIK